MEIFDGMTTRQAAIQRGVKLYFSGKPCKRGHLSARYTASGQCVECVKVHNGSLNASYSTQSVVVKVPTREAAFRVFLFAQALQKEHEEAGNVAVALHNKLMAQKLEMEQRQHMAEFNARLSTR